MRSRIGAFERYLRVEYGFVDCAAIVMGYAVAKAPSFAERVRLALGLHGLVTDQHDFFVAAFEEIGADAGFANRSAAGRSFGSAS